MNDASRSSDLLVNVVRTNPRAERDQDSEQHSRTRSLHIPFAPVQLGDGSRPAIQRASVGISAEDAARKIMSLCIESGAAPADVFATLADGGDFEISRFPGALQRKFLEAGYGTDDLKAGLAFAVDRNWLALGRRYGDLADVQTYALTQAGLDPR